MQPNTDGYGGVNQGNQQPPPGQYGAPPTGQGNPYAAPPTGQGYPYGAPPPGQANPYGAPPTNPPQYGQPNVGGPYQSAPAGGPGVRGYGNPPPPYGQQPGYGAPPPVNKEYEAAPPLEEDDDYQRTIMAQWDEHMSDFEPSDMLTINIPSRTDEIFYEHIQEVPSKVRGAYYIGSGEKKLIDFWVIDPSNRIFNTVQGKNEGLFVFDAQQTGVYQFVFSNSRYWEAKDLTFAIHFGNHTDDHASAEHLDPLHENLKKALKNIKNLYSEVKFSVGRQDSHNTTIRSSMSMNYWISILETLCIVGLAAAQIYFIKRILQHKKVL